MGTAIGHAKFAMSNNTRERKPVTENRPHLDGVVDPSEIAVTIGLLSDTHMPLRMRRLPPELADVFADVDLLLHAGDVGRLHVLEELGQIAPVIAVHGNDDSEEAQRELPLQQLICVRGLRILLWHSHFPDWDEEMAFRQDDDLYRSLKRSVEQGKRAGAQLVVFGHWHIPLCYQKDGITVVNPGALASANAFSRMTRKTVARLTVTHAGTPHITHLDLADPTRPYTPVIDWDAGFIVAWNQFSRSILAPEVEPLVPYLRSRLTIPQLLALRHAIDHMGHPIWEGEDRLLTVDDFTDALGRYRADLPEDVYHYVKGLIDEWRASPPTS